MSQPDESRYLMGHSVSGGRAPRWVLRPLACNRVKRLTPLPDWPHACVTCKRAADGFSTGDLRVQVPLYRVMSLRARLC